MLQIGSLAIIMLGWGVGFRIGWRLMDRHLERRKHKAIKAKYEWKDRPPQGGRFISRE